MNLEITDDAVSSPAAENHLSPSGKRIEHVVTHATTATLSAESKDTFSGPEAEEENDSWDDGYLCGCHEDYVEGEEHGGDFGAPLEGFAGSKKMREKPGTFMARVAKRSQFYKTRLCPWMQTNQCGRADKCNYAHSEMELRQAPDLSRTRICPTVLEGKVCTRSSCSFAHSVEDLRATNAFFKTRMCNDWRAGVCTAGVECRMAHGENELRHNPVFGHTKSTSRENSKERSLFSKADLSNSGSLSFSKQRRKRFPTWSTSTVRRSSESTPKEKPTVAFMTLDSKDLVGRDHLPRERNFGFRPPLARSSTMIRDRRKNNSGDVSSWSRSDKLDARLSKFASIGNRVDKFEAWFGRDDSQWSSSTSRGGYSGLCRSSDCERPLASRAASSMTHSRPWRSGREITFANEVHVAHDETLSHQHPSYNFQDSEEANVLSGVILMPPQRHHTTNREFIAAAPDERSRKSSRFNLLDGSQPIEGSSLLDTFFNCSTEAQRNFFYTAAPHMPVESDVSITVNKPPYPDTMHKAPGFHESRSMVISGTARTSSFDPSKPPYSSFSTAALKGAIASIPSKFYTDGSCDSTATTRPPSHGELVFDKSDSVLMGNARWKENTTLRETMPDNKFFQGGFHHLNSLAPAPGYPLGYHQSNSDMDSIFNAAGSLPDPGAATIDLLPLPEAVFGDAGQILGEEFYEQQQSQQGEHEMANQKVVHAEGGGLSLPWLPEVPLDQLLAACPSYYEE